ncbi:MAG: hypothetical protein HY329_20350, partial [Chloroflexi bacterium]|nr:hypothetical protein [Chloroflexota bacterium]
PPTPERVERVLGGTRRDPDEVVGLIAPAWGKATVRQIAVNSVMAGCGPEHLPIVITAVEAMIEPEFNLGGVQATTNAAAPLAIVNGPLALQLDFNFGPNVFGQGWRANAVVGRAVRLILLNVGGGQPGTVDKSSFGQPGKYSFCISENEADSPWESLRAERGFGLDDTTVTVAGVAGPHTVIVMGSLNGEETLMTIARAMTAAGNNLVFMDNVDPVVAVTPEYADIVARDGFSKAEVKRFLWEHAVLPLSAYYSGQREIAERWKPRNLFERNGEPWIRMVERPEDTVFLVAGKHGKHATFCPSFDSRSVTKRVGR